MLYKANVPLIVKSDYVKKGQEFEATPKEMAHYDAADFSKVDTTPPAPEPEPVDVPLDEMNLEQLRAKAKELGLSAGGSKADILERIKLNASDDEEDADEEDED